MPYNSAHSVCVCFLFYKKALQSDFIIFKKYIETNAVKHDLMIMVLLNYT